MFNRNPHVTTHADSTLLERPTVKGYLEPMPTFEIRTIRNAAQRLRPNGSRIPLGIGVYIEMTSTTLRIQENGMEVFKISVEINGYQLWLDRAETSLSQRRRGWGSLGLLIALYYGSIRGATTVGTATDVERSALRFWNTIYKNSRASITLEMARRTPLEGPVSVRAARHVTRTRGYSG